MTARGDRLLEKNKKKDVSVKKGECRMILHTYKNQPGESAYQHNVKSKLETDLLSKPFDNFMEMLVTSWLDVTNMVLKNHNCAEAGSGFSKINRGCRTLTKVDGMICLCYVLPYLHIFHRSDY